MSLEQHSIDKGYKTRLRNLEITPPAHAWAAIAARLPTEKSNEKGLWLWGSGSVSSATPEEKVKRERIVFWWWTGAIVALAVISMLAYYSLNATTNNNSPTPTPKSSATAFGPIAAASNLNINEQSNAAVNEEEDCPQLIATTTSLEILTTGAIPTTKEKTRNEMSRVSRASTLIVATPSELTQLAAPKATTTSSSKSTVNKNTEPAYASSTELNPETGSIGLSVTSLAINQLPLAGLSLLETETTKLPFGPGVGCPSFNNSTTWNFAIRAFVGPGTIIQAYNSTDQTATYASLRDSIESKQLSVNAGLRLEAVNDKGLFIRAGADYQMYRSNIESLGPRMSRTVIDSVFMEDTQTWRVETRNESFQEQRKVYNRQHAVVLTAGLGFRKTIGNVSPYIMAEAGYEFLIKRKGTFVLPDGNFVDLAEDDQGLYINDRPGFQFGGVVGVDFALTDRIEAGISAHYKQLGGLRGSADLLDYNQSTAFGALNLRYTIR